MKRLKQKCRIGRIIMNGVDLATHEYDTILFLVKFGKDVELIRRTQTPKSKNADFYMNALIWEAKSPVVNERRALERAFYRASTQSSNLIFDLRRLKGNDVTAKQTFEKCFQTTRKVRNMYIITKQPDLLEYKKK